MVSQTILVLGAGRSATVLIDYLARQAPALGWQLAVADADLALAQEKTRPYPAARALAFDIHDAPRRRAAVAEAAMVVSLLPADLHVPVAHDCLALRRHLLTASYVSPAMRALDADARAAGLLFLNEMGLDPGLDHLSAMQLIHTIQGRGGVVTGFKSFCGGLVAPASDDNPWGYKITWNPRNVVLAGQGTATFLEDGHVREVPYADLFARVETIAVPGYGPFEAYPNRDSLGYRDLYGLAGVRTMLRGTLRRPGYCAAWRLLVQGGFTDDAPLPAPATRRALADRLLPGPGPLAYRLARHFSLPVDDPAVQRVAWLALDQDAPDTYPTAARALQATLEQQWRMQPPDRDLVVMQHQFGYLLNGRSHQLVSSLAVEGDDATRTAMAKTVGLPLGIAAKLLWQGKLAHRGVVVPVYPDLYAPVLAELTTLGVVFHEQETIDRPRA